MSTAKAERNKIGERLKNAREYLGLSQEEVSKVINIPRSALSAIESGLRGVDVLELKALAKIYKLPVSHLTDESPTHLALPADIAHLARAASQLAKKDRVELGRFAEYLGARGKTKKRPDE
jgi:transcriptional regulator with XRE-family HTH domain